MIDQDTSPRNKTPFWLKMIGFTFLGLMGAVIFALLLGLAVQWLWNKTIPELFNGPVITYWHAVGLLLLSKLFFGSFCKPPHRHPHPPKRWIRHHWREHGDQDENKPHTGENN